ncbi:hypothetical protein IJE86_02565 [bacterium]|nr:hypothetical protein [bacterium]
MLDNLIKLVEDMKMHEYVLKLKKGELEIEIKSDDLEFIKEQLQKWHNEIVS